jgi:hypothetical protein
MQQHPVKLQKQELPVRIVGLPVSTYSTPLSSVGLKRKCIFYFRENQEAMLYFAQNFTKFRFTFVFAKSLKFSEKSKTLLQEYVSQKLY